MSARKVNLHAGRDGPMDAPLRNRDRSVEDDLKSTAADDVLVVEGVTKRFGNLEAVRNLSFSVRRGEFLTLLGPSGCGKSTTLMTIAGFEKPSAGRVLLDGVDVTGLPPDRRGMGVVFQNYALFPHMTALENVLFPLRMRDYGRQEAKEQALEVLQLVQLPNPRAKPHELSGGQMQRVALARALVFDPSVLLMDEPLAALDRRLRQDMQFEIRKIQAQLDTTVIYVTHDQEEALVLSDRVAVMRAGRFEQVAPPREIYDQPTNGFVANFLGESNTAEVRVVCREGAMRVVRSGDDGVTWRGIGSVDPDTDALLVVRPEDIVVIEDRHPITDDGNTCTAKVIDVAFLGDHIRIEVEVEGSISLSTTGTWTVRTNPRTPQQTPETGERIRLTWPAAATKVIAP